VFRNAIVFDPVDGFREADVVVGSGLVQTVLPAGTAPETEDAEVIEAAGATLLPGFIDAHAHPLIAGQEAIGLSVRRCTTVAEVQARVQEYAAQHPDLPFIAGEGFELTLAPGAQFFAADLDAVVPDRPVALRSNDIHTYWCNTAALTAAGIDADFPDPVDGVVERLPDGRPSGTLREWGAFQPVRAAMPESTAEQRAEQLLAGLQALAEDGVTSVMDAWVDPVDLDGYLLAADRGLPLRLDLALRAEPATWAGQVAEFTAIRDVLAARSTAARLSATTVKFYADGIIEGGTAAVHAPYTASTGSACCGLPNWAPAALAEAVAAFDGAGFEVHIHAIGDAAVTAALDAIEALPARNGERDRRPAIAHAQLVSERDRRRFAETGTTAVMQPYWAKLDDVVTRLTLHRLADDRAQEQYPTASLLAAGVNVAFSSDFPISTGNPLAGVAIAMSRNEDGDPANAWLPHELVDRRAALTAYTAGAARITRTHHGGARLAPGAVADLVLVGADLRSATPAELLVAPVRGVWVDGAAPLNRNPTAKG
jgi:predicted amidohydrolase YtcJ